MLKKPMNFYQASNQTSKKYRLFTKIIMFFKITSNKIEKINKIQLNLIKPNLI